MKLIEEFTYEQAEEMLHLLDGEIWMQALITVAVLEAILEALDESDRRTWQSPDDLIRWLYSAKEAWK